MDAPRKLSSPPPIPPRISSAAVTPTANKAVPDNQNENIHYFDIEVLRKSAPKMDSSDPAEVRRAVLLDTVDRIMADGPAIKANAQTNHEKWAAQQVVAPLRSTVEVVEGDWGDVTLAATIASGGKMYVVLNMANANRPGGGVLHGALAQEENEFRRSDAFLTGKSTELFRNSDGSLFLTLDGSTLYNDTTRDLINGIGGRAYLDIENPRVCFRDGDKNKYGIDPGKAFLFYEMRSAALDLRQEWACRIGKDEIEKATREKIAGQLDTLTQQGQKRAVLSAFGCGAFLNEPEIVARLYKEELEKRIDNFDHVVFAIYKGEKDQFTNDPGAAAYMAKSEKNLTCFKKELDGFWDEKPESVTKTGHFVFLVFKAQSCAAKFADQYGIEEGKSLPAVDDQRIPGKFLVRLPVSKYDDFRNKNAGLMTFLPADIETIKQEPSVFKVTGTGMPTQDPIAPKWINSYCLALNPAQQSKDEQAVVNVFLKKPSFAGSELRLELEFSSPEKAELYLGLLKGKGLKHISTGYFAARSKISFEDSKEYKQFLAECGVFLQDIKMR